MKKLSDDSLMGPGRSGKNVDEDWTDVEEVEVRTKEGTAVFEVIEVALGQLNHLKLEKDGVEVQVSCNLSPRGKYDSPAKMRKVGQCGLRSGESTQVMEISPA